MAISNAEWWMRAAARPRPEVSVGDKLRQSAEFMAANVGQALLKLVDPPYPTPDGKPLAVHFYKPEESPFTMEQMEQLAVIVKLSEAKS